MAGKKGAHRGAMLVPGYGTLYLHIASLGYGISIVAQEGVSKFSRSLYVEAKTAGSFNMELVFFTHAQYEQFSKIMLHYGNNLARGLVGSPCRVMVPSVKDAKGQGFDRVGIPRSPVPFGDNVTTVTYRATLDFIGTSEPYSPVGVRNVAQVSNVLGAEYAQAIKRNPQAAYYYPVGRQLSGSHYGVDTLYDSAPSGEVFEEASVEDVAAGVDPRTRSDGTPIGGL